MNKVNAYKVLVGSKDLKESSLVRVFALNEGDAAAQANKSIRYKTGNVVESIVCEQRGVYNA